MKKQLKFVNIKLINELFLYLESINPPPEYLFLNKTYNFIYFLLLYHPIFYKYDTTNHH